MRKAIFIFVIYLTYVLDTFALQLDCRRFCSQLNDPHNCSGMTTDWANSRVTPYHYFSSCKKCATDVTCKDSFSQTNILNQCNQCSGISRNPYVPLTASLTKKMDLPTRKKLFELRSKIKQWVLCNHEPFKLAPHSGVRKCVDSPSATLPSSLMMDYRDGQGDNTILAGISCLAGITERCNEVKLAQEIDNPQSKSYGAFWRAPSLIRSSHNEITFSRDQTLGMLSYFAVTKDRTAAKLWLNFVLKNKLVNYPLPAPSWFKFFNVCPPLAGKETDGRCVLTPNVWGLVGKVWDYLGITNTAPLIARQHMIFGKSISNRTMEVEASTQPVLGNQQYQPHLIIQTILLERAMGRDNSTLRNAPKILSTRTYDENPLFLYTAYGITQRAAELILRYCGKNSPDFNRPIYPGGPEVRGGWIGMGAQQFYHATVPHGVYRVESGHDCLVMLNWMLK